VATLDDTPPTSSQTLAEPFCHVLHLGVAVAARRTSDSHLTDSLHSNLHLWNHAAESLSAPCRSDKETDRRRTDGNGYQAALDRQVAMDAPPTPVGCAVARAAIEASFAPARSNELYTCSIHSNLRTKLSDAVVRGPDEAGCPLAMQCRCLQSAHSGLPPGAGDRTSLYLHGFISDSCGALMLALQLASLLFEPPLLAASHSHAADRAS
jgi:hypothetical protein